MQCSIITSKGIFSIHDNEYLHVFPVKCIHCPW